MAKDAKTVQDLLLQAIYHPEGGLKGYSRVYGIRDFPDYLVRTALPRRAFKEQLENTTSLHGVHLVDGDYGQMVFTNGKDIDILKRLPGVSLTQLHAERSSHYRKELTTKGVCEWLAYRDILKMLDGLPASAYEDFLLSVKYLTKNGIPADMHNGNILFDKSAGTLKLTDVSPGHLCRTRRARREELIGHDEVGTNHLSNITDALLMLRSDSDRSRLKLVDRRLYNTVCALEDTLAARLDSAAQSTGYPMTKVQIRRLAPKQEYDYPDYRRVRRTFAQVALDDSPQTFRERLMKMEEYSRQQGR